VQATTTRPKITAAADGEGVVSHAGSRLLADVADRTTLTAELGEVLGGLRKARARSTVDEREQNLDPSYDWHRYEQQLGHDVERDRDQGHER
jgi:hypothetical protein